MEIENKLKAMGLELPAAGTPPAGRAGRSKLGTYFSSAGTRRGQRTGASWERRYPWSKVTKPLKKRASTV